MNVLKLIETIRNDKECIFKEGSQLPLLPYNLSLPKDLETFYQNCSGIIFFPGKEYSMEIVSPIDFVRANPVIIGEEGDSDISYNWFIIGKAGLQYITIDLAPARKGRCYDSFWDSHGLVGDTPIISLNFSSLVESLYQGKGDYWYWLQDGFNSLGDAYD